jgi:dihydroxyacetone kinase
MKRLANEPSAFTEEMTDGFVAANGQWVVKAPGGVVRAKVETKPTVSIVIGGGSGHYPAFAGLVGHGLANGAAMGNIFASPSAHQVYSIARSTERGSGVLLSYGNYAGDVLHFTQAQDRLRAEGIDCRTIAVTDDIFSAPRDELNRRRGIAGDLMVFKIAGAAAAEGHNLDAVEAYAIRANERTRSMGVAFGGTTLPGADSPLFTVPDGRMAIGLGIHGEPGIAEIETPSANGLAELFVERLLGEVPAGVEVAGARVVPMLNGLGSVKCEELFIVFRRIDELLRDHGIVVVDPQVGEFCTSFDMAGASLTLFWLDEGLERLWKAPADSPAFRRGGEISAPEEWADATVFHEEHQHSVSSSLDSQLAGTTALRLLQAMKTSIEEHFEELGRLDAIAGDGDHGIGMQRGIHAAVLAAKQSVEERAGLGYVLSSSGNAWSDKGGGTSGAIWGVILKTIGDSLGDHYRPTSIDVARAVAMAADAVQVFGKAKLGDKTMVDALIPFSESLSREAGSGKGLTSAWRTAATSAMTAALSTSELTAGIGRARIHGAKSLGSPDPGALSLAQLVAAIGIALG